MTKRRQVGFSGPVDASEGDKKREGEQQSSGRGWGEAMRSGRDAGERTRNSPPWMGDDAHADNVRVRGRVAPCRVDASPSGRGGQPGQQQSSGL